MFSLQMLFGKADRFYQLLEDAASEAHGSVRLVIELIKSPDSAKGLDDLALSRRKEKKIGEQITTELVKTFVTGLEREDIEAARCSPDMSPAIRKTFRMGLSTPLVARVRNPSKKSLPSNSKDQETIERRLTFGCILQGRRAISCRPRYKSVERPIAIGVRWIHFH